MKLQSFDGGLSTRLRPQFLSLNQGAEYVNIDSDVGSLAPVMLPEETDIEVKRYQQWYDAKQMWVQSDNRRDYVEFQGLLYWTDRVGQPKVFDGTTERNLGIANPTNRPSVAANQVAVSPRGFTANTSFTSGNLPAIDLYYLFVGPGTKATFGRVNVAGKFSVVGEDVVSIPTPVSVKDSDSGTTHSTVFSNFTNTTNVYRYYKDDWRLVGTGGTVTDSTYDISGNAKLADDALPTRYGIYTYVYTFYNSATGVESGYSLVSAEANIRNGGTVTVSGLLVSSDPQVDKKRVYRVGGNVSTFTLVKELSNDVASFVDNIDDSDLPSISLPQPLASPAPNGLAFLTEAYAMLFGAVGSTLRFTPVGVPTSWPELYFIEYEAPITGIAQVANGILVFTKFKTHIVTGTGPTSLTTHLLSGDQGCLAFESIQQYGTEALWVSSDGICASSGGLPTVLTKELLGKVSINAIDSAVYDEVYYVQEEDKTWALDKGKVKQFDFGIKTLNVANDELYGYLNGKLVKLFRGSNPATFKLKTARFVEGAITNHKTYKKVFLFSEGCVTIKILINDVEVAKATFDTKDNHTIQVPATLQRGFYIQFELEGTGEVFELEYEVGQQ